MIAQASLPTFADCFVQFANRPSCRSAMPISQTFTNEHLQCFNKFISQPDFIFLIVQCLCHCVPHSSSILISLCPSLCSRVSHSWTICMLCSASISLQPSSCAHFKLPWGEDKLLACSGAFPAYPSFLTPLVCHPPCESDVFDDLWWSL